MKIPTEYQIFAQTTRVLFSDTLIDKNDAIGEMHYRINEMYLHANSNAVNRPEKEIEQAFFHELIHDILNKLHEYKLRDNEKFVDTFAYALHQALTTAMVGKEKFLKD